MPGNSFGQLFKITTAGESHGLANIVIIDGVPAGMSLSVSDLQPDLNRRRPGQSKLTTQRKETDIPEILSGVFDGETTGVPITILVPFITRIPVTPFLLISIIVYTILLCVTVAQRLTFTFKTLKTQNAKEKNI